jgi:hypothetical protein
MRYVQNYVRVSTRQDNKQRKFPVARSIIMKNYANHIHAQFTKDQIAF